jgi:hypothetical protein
MGSDNPVEISLETVRLANLGSSRVFNKGLGDLISDFEKNADGVPADLVPTLASIGRLIERAAAGTSKSIL